MSRPTVLIAGGGTGGHVFPAVAVAERMEALADVEVVFCGTRRGVEARVVPARGWRLELLDVEPMKGGGTCARHPRRVRRGAGHGACRGARTRDPSDARCSAWAGMRRARSRWRRRSSACRSPSWSRTAWWVWPIDCSRRSRGVRTWHGTRRGHASARRRGASTGGSAAGGLRAETLSSRAARARVLVMGGSQGAAALNERMPAGDRAPRATCPGSR